MARVIQETHNEVPLYRLAAYRTVGGWKEFVHRVGLLWMLCMMTVGVIFLAIANSTTGIRPYDVLFTVGFSTAVSVGATLVMIGLKHPNAWVRRAVGILPIVLVVGVSLV